MDFYKIVYISLLLGSLYRSCNHLYTPTIFFPDRIRDTVTNRGNVSPNKIRKSLSPPNGRARRTRADDDHDKRPLPLSQAKTTATTTTTAYNGRLQYISDNKLETTLYHLLLLCPSLPPPLFARCRRLRRSLVRSLLLSLTPFFTYLFVHKVQP